MSLLQQFHQSKIDADADKLIKLIDGKATLYKRPRSTQWQVRFKLNNNKWHCQSTNTTDIEQAKSNAMYIYQTVQIKTEAGLSPITKTFKQIAKDELANMAQAMTNGVGKRTYRDYTFAINKYLIPFFGNYAIENITAQMVSGKTGPRYLIAKNEVLVVLERLMRWQDLPYATLDILIEEKLDRLIFRLTTGEQISNMENIFRNLMKHSGLMYDSGGQRRTLYSLRHTYATRALAKGVDIHTLARQMGTSVLMIEKHYSKITPMLSAEKLAQL